MGTEIKIVTIICAACILGIFNAVSCEIKTACLRNVKSVECLK